MIPRKPKSRTDKGKEIRAAASAETPPTLPLSEIADTEGLGSIRFLVGGVNNEWGRTKLKVTGTPDVDDTIAPFFLFFLIAGLVPLFSDFFLAILEHYQVHMLHLHPNAVLTLAIFTHLCEAFVGAMPSLELIRHFFAMRLIPGNQVFSCVCFHLASKAKEASIISLELYTHVKEWCWKWVHTDTLWASPLLQELDTRAEKRVG